MSKKISIIIGGKRFDLNIDEQFAPFLEKQMASDLNIEGNNDVKKVLEAYVRKSYELFLQEQKAKEILKKLD